ncbi:MAG: DUF3179 domain-containing protein [Flavobacteriaceae bacterium]
MKNNIFYVIIISLLLIGCGGSDEDINLPNNGNGNGNSGNSGGNGSGNNSNDEWLIPIDEVRDGGPGKDGIPSIDSPSFAFPNTSQSAFLNDDDLVVGLVNGNIVRAYPYPIMNWHEIVNDRIAGEKISISYCPLTGTAFGWRSFVDGTSTTFGVSGLLYNANLILYDRLTDSNWSQIALLCVNGEQIGDTPELVQVVETTWGFWKFLHPNTQVMTTETGFTRDYDYYPYGDYRTNHDFFLFPPSPTNNAIPNKERVFAIISDNGSKVYQFNVFGSGNVIKEQFNGKDYLIVGSGEFIVGFELESDNRDLTFTYELDASNEVTLFTDNEGNKWTIHGKAISGPRQGQNLKPAKSVISYWFAIAAFYPNPEIYAN